MSGPGSLRRRRRTREPRLRALEGGSEALALDGLEQVVERVHLECLHRVFVVRRHEYDERHSVGADGFDDAEAVDLRHLDVQEHEIRRVFVDRQNRLRAVPALGDDLHVRVIGDQRPHARARERLVIDNQHANPRWIVLLCCGAHDSSSPV